MKIYIYCKLQNTPNAWCIRPVDWEGCWNNKQELYAGSYVALFNTEEEAKMICEQLNSAYYNNEKIKVAIDKLYCWGEVLDADFQKEMLEILGDKNE